MRSLFAAELLRLRKRRSLQAIVLAVPLLVGAIFVAGYHSIYEPPPFDAAAYRQELIDGGFGIGLPPEDLEPLLAEAVESWRQEVQRQQDQAALTRANFTFPFSLVAVLGSGLFVLVALVLLAALTIGDEFSWGTLRTALIASSHRGRFLAVRLAALGLTGLVIFGLLLLVGTMLPVVLAIPPSKLPATLPVFDIGALGILLGGELIAALLAIAFAGLVTLMLRSGALTLLAAVVWLAVEAAILSLLQRFPNIGGGTVAGDGSFTPGPDAWLLEVFPLRGMTTLMTNVGKAASGLPSYPGEVFSRDPGIAIVPMASFAIVAVVMLLLAFRRFGRMDVVE